MENKILEKKKVFMIMPFKDEFFEVYEMLKNRFAESFTFSHAGDEGNQQNILKDIIQPIYEADIIIADLSGLNANVMYELGVAHTFNKKVIIITQDDLATLPFDLKQYRAKDYNTHFKKFAELIDYLETNLNGAVDGSVLYSNPVKDFLTLERIDGGTWFKQKETIYLEDDSDKGFIDFLADIEDNASKLNADIESMSSDMREMTSGITDCTMEIERVNKSGGSGNAAFVRKQAKKAASFVENFSQKLKGHNSSITELWDEIEKNTLGLLENPFSVKEENKSHLITYLKSLPELKNASILSKESIGDLIASLDRSIGLERSMNQAIRFIKEDLTTYQNLSDKICASIDKILAKSRFVVGEIDFGQTVIASEE